MKELVKGRFAWNEVTTRKVRLSMREDVCLWAAAFVPGPGRYRSLSALVEAVLEAHLAAETPKLLLKQGRGRSEIERRGFTGERLAARLEGYRQRVAAQKGGGS